MDTKLNSPTESVGKGEIKVGSFIHGQLNYNKDSNVFVKSIQIFLAGTKEAIATVSPTVNDQGASFQYVIEAQSRTGDYKAVWQVYNEGKEANVMTEFTIDADGLDRTLPIELQHLT